MARPVRDLGPAALEVVTRAFSGRPELRVSTGVVTVATHLGHATDNALTVCSGLRPPRPRESTLDVE